MIWISNKYMLPGFKTKNIVLILFIGLCVSKCFSIPKYQVPGHDENTALIKLKYSYAMMLEGKNLRVDMLIKEGQDSKWARGYQKEYGKVSSINKPVLEIYAMKIRVGKMSLIKMNLDFHWTSQRMITETRTVNGQAQTTNRWVTDYHHRGCTMGVKFIPVKDKMYLLDYTNLDIDKGCILNAYEQIVESKGKFNLLPVGKPCNTNPC